MICEGEPPFSIITAGTHQPIPVTDEDVERGTLEPGWLLCYGPPPVVDDFGPMRQLACGLFPGRLQTSRCTNGRWCTLITPRWPQVQCCLLRYRILDADAEDELCLHPQWSGDENQLRYENGRVWLGTSEIHVAWACFRPSEDADADAAVPLWLYRRQPCSLK